MSGTRDWDATTYDRISAPQQAWAAEQLSRLQLRGDEVVLDAGCGSGKITAVLAELVPRGRVYRSTRPRRWSPIRSRRSVTGPPRCART